MDRLHPLRVLRGQGRISLSGYLVGVPEHDVRTYLRSWMIHFADRGKIQLTHSGWAASIELRIRRWKTRPPVALFRLRNADGSRNHFGEARRRLDDAGVTYEVTLTRKRARPRAIEIPLDPEDPLTPQVVLDLLVRTLDAARGAGVYDIACYGTTRAGMQDRAVPLHYPESAESQSYRVGVKLGKAVGRVFGR